MCKKGLCTIPLVHCANCFANLSKTIYYQYNIVYFYRAFMKQIIYILLAIFIPIIHTWASDSNVNKVLSERYAYYHQHQLDTHNFKLHTLEITQNQVDSLYYIFSTFYSTYLAINDSLGNIVYQDSMIPLMGIHHTHFRN